MMREDVVMMFSKIVYFYFLVLLYDDMGTNIRPELVAPRFGAPRLDASGLGVSELGVSGFFLSRSFSNRQWSIFGAPHIGLVKSFFLELHDSIKRYRTRITWPLNWYSWANIRRTRELHYQILSIIKYFTHQGVSSCFFQSEIISP